MVDSRTKKQTEITILDFETELPESTFIVAGHSLNLLETLISSKVEINHSCGGNGTCGTCRVFVVSGLESLSPRTDIEIEMAESRKMAENERLCCQIDKISDLKIKIPR